MVWKKYLGLLAFFMILMLLTIGFTIFRELFYRTSRLKVTTTTQLFSKENVSAVNHVEIYVLVDNNEYNGFQAAWGVSYFVKTDTSTFLFDVGPNIDVLMFNAEKLGVNINHTEFIIISHEHGDHCGSLRRLNDLLKEINVYIPADASSSLIKHVKKLNYNVVLVNDTIRVAPGTYIVGELYGPPWEQAVAINVKDKGLVILSGCSHPGVERIVEKAVKELGVKPYMVIGGFHLAGASESKIRNTISKLLSLDIEKIYPLHCSGDKIRNILALEYSEKYGDGHVGLVLKIDDRKK